MEVQVLSSAQMKRSGMQCRERANCLARVRGLEDVEVTATSLRYEGEVRSETCTVPAEKKIPLLGTETTASWWLIEILGRHACLIEQVSQGMEVQVGTMC